MSNEGDVNAASTTNVRLAGGKKNRKGKKHQKSNEEMFLDPTPSEALTSQPCSTIEASDDELGEEAIDVTAEHEWVARVEVARQAVEILGRCMNVADGKFNTLEDFNLAETDNIPKELEGRQRAEFEMKEAITSLECQLMEALSTIETMKAEMKTLMTIEEAIKNVEALTDFRHEKPDRIGGEDMRGCHDDSGGDCGKVEEQRPHPKKHDTSEGEGCTLARTRRRDDTVGLDRIMRAITKQLGKPKGYGAQYLDLTINGIPASPMVDTGAEANIMTKTAATRLGLSYSPSNAQLMTVNAPPTPMCGVAQEQCHMVIDPYLQQLLVMEQGGSCMVPLVKVPTMEERVCLMTMQLEKNPKKKESTFIATTASSKEVNGAKRSLPPRTKKVPKENNVVMPKKPPRRLPPRNEVDHKTELEGIWKTLKKLREGLDRVNELLVAHAQDSDDYATAICSGHCINRWGRVSCPATSQSNFASG
uniref:Uncharacterized protein n=1 Tax=Solanum tuberosum TaxID=4113 RepID=M0ZXX2_SOLTU